MFCTHCATFNPPTAARCQSCGAFLERAPASTSRLRPSSHRDWLLAIPLVLLLVILAGIFWQDWSARQDRATAYNSAIVALGIGDLPTAITLFGQAGDYRDAQTQRISVQQRLAVYQAAILDARTALDRGETRNAIELVNTIITEFPRDRPTLDLLAIAKEQFHTDLVRASSLAIANRDWLQAERLFLQLAYWDATDPAIESLASLRLEHAPILFAQNGVLARIGPDMADRQLIYDDTPVLFPVWSPDRTRIAFSSTGDPTSLAGALSIIDSDGKHPILVDDHALIVQSVWSPDGNQLVYSTVISSASDRPITVLRIFDLSTGTTQTVSPPEGFDRLLSPSFAGDGRQLVAIARTPDETTALLIIDMETLETTVLPIALPPDLRSVSWSPTADMLLLWTSPNDSGITSANGNTITLLSITDLVSAPVTPATQAPSRPVWAPDGRHFAYLDRDKTLHIRLRDGIGDRSIGLPGKGNGHMSWCPGGVALLIPAYDPNDPVMIIPVSERLGPVARYSLPGEKDMPAIDFRWGPDTMPAPELYDPLRSSEESRV